MGELPFHPCSPVMVHPPSQALGVQQRARHRSVPGETDSFITALWARCFSGGEPRAAGQCTGGAADPTMRDLSGHWKKSEGRAYADRELWVSWTIAWRAGSERWNWGKGQMVMLLFPMPPSSWIFLRLTRSCWKILSIGVTRSGPCLPSICSLHLSLPSYPNKLLHPSELTFPPLLPHSPPSAPGTGPMVWSAFPQSPEKISHSFYHSVLQVSVYLCLLLLGL